MPWQSILEAHVYWRRHGERDAPRSNLDDAEAFILSQKPATIEDTLCILDVVLENHGDSRSDGLDHAAIGHVRDFLSSEIGVAAASKFAS